LRIGKYRIYLKNSGSLIFPFIVLSFCTAYLIQSSKIFTNLTMLLVRLTFYAIVVFTFLVLKEEIQITTGKKTDSRKAPNNFFADKRKRIWFFIIGMGAYIVLLDKLGFILSTLFFTSIMMNMLGIKDKKILILLPVCLVTIIYFMFSAWLMVPLPSGILTF